MPSEFLLSTISKQVVRVWSNFAVDVSVPAGNASEIVAERIASELLGFVVDLTAEAKSYLSSRSCIGLSSYMTTSPFDLVTTCGAIPREALCNALEIVRPTDLLKHNAAAMILLLAVWYWNRASPVLAAWSSKVVEQNSYPVNVWSATFASCDGFSSGTETWVIAANILWIIWWVPVWNGLCLIYFISRRLAVMALVACFCNLSFRHRSWMALAAACLSIAKSSALLPRGIPTKASHLEDLRWARDLQLEPKWLR